ncbi:hypothetical protein JTE90_000480 [Oedothorax gibbosus]|uniref:Prokineticin domain-containing protein n=1 Tax=Oedothorax gibbosus TaxID=931172 RepID=A0AAV6TXW1_9ARAC|nr:hypothetical protein JTE90_000480 [Oedothorax gibbosus]
MRDYHKHLRSLKRSFGLKIPAQLLFSIAEKMHRKMSACLAVVVCFLLFTKRVAISEGPMRSCFSQLECSDNECCVQKGTFVYCKLLSKKGSRCSSKPNYNNTIHIQYCPCISSYWCDNDRSQSMCMPYEDIY